MVPVLLRFIVLAFFLKAGKLAAQAYSYTVFTQPEKCAGGSAALETEGLDSADQLSIEWSSGDKNISSIKNLEAGDYWLRVTITSPGDSLPVITDTTLLFTITNERCPVGVPLHFSPNGDGYNDDLRLSNISRYPDFELQIFNRWGQLVHRQKKNYTPWNGEWAGIRVPDGTYYYVLFYDASNKRDHQKGDITILR